MPHASPFIHARALAGSPQAFARSVLASSIADGLGAAGITLVGGSSASGKSTLIAQVSVHASVRVATVNVAQAFGPAALAHAMRQQLGGPDMAAPSGDPLEGLVGAPAAPDLLQQLTTHADVPALALDDAGALLAWNDEQMASLSQSLAAHSAGVVICASRAHASQLAERLGLPSSLIDLDESEAADEAQIAAGLIALGENTAHSLDDLAAQAIARLGRRHLRSCQLLADRAWTLAEGPVDLDAVRSAWQSLLADSHGSFCAAFTQLTDGSAQDQRLARVLCLVADNAGGRLRSDELAERYQIGASGRMAIQRDLVRLASLGLVQPLGSSWQLADPLLQAWLSARSPWR